MFFFGKSFFRVFELPLLRNAQKTRLKKSMKKRKKNRASNYFFFSAAANVRHFRHFFFTAPLAPSTSRTSQATSYIPDLMAAVR
jgi:hypothetical protein